MKLLTRTVFEIGDEDLPGSLGGASRADTSGNAPTVTSRQEGSPSGEGTPPTTHRAECLGLAALSRARPRAAATTACLVLTVVALAQLPTPGAKVRFAAWPSRGPHPTTDAGIGNGDARRFVSPPAG